MILLHGSSSSSACTTAWLMPAAVSRPHGALEHDLALVEGDLGRGLEHGGRAPGGLGRCSALGLLLPAMGGPKLLAGAPVFERRAVLPGGHGDIVVAVVRLARVPPQHVEKQEAGQLLQLALTAGPALLKGHPRLVGDGEAVHGDEDVSRDFTLAVGDEVGPPAAGLLARGHQVLRPDGQQAVVEGGLGGPVQDEERGAQQLHEVADAPAAVRLLEGLACAPLVEVLLLVPHRQTHIVAKVTLSGII
mmetsp:Transcript_10191/g.16489  ORF Transcript_10191/g.16489 Transcript_10191/m.16489 type:complete len:247 (+) Transcript_10191:243-983(+)